MKRVSHSTIREIRRRVQRNEGAELLERTVRNVPIPRTPYAATVFIYTHSGRLVFLAELVHPDLPHVYNAVIIKNESQSSVQTALVDTLARLSYTVLNDPRFARGKIITLNGYA